jgi:uncharacterized phage protein (TIGR02218 family)
MKTCSTALQNLLMQYARKEKTTWYIAELYTFWLNYGLAYNAGTFNSGRILIYTGHDTDLQIGGNIYRHWSIEHGDIEEKRGVETSSTTVTINYNPFDKIQDLNVTWYLALQSGLFDNCYLSLDRLYSPIPWAYQMPNMSSDYVLKDRFFGKLDVSTDNGVKMTSCQAKLEAPTKLLNMNLPRNLIASQCLNGFCDSMCGLSKSNYSYTITAQAGSSKTAIVSNLSFADGYFSQGSMLGLTGKNTGVSKTIKTYISNISTPGDPWTFDVAAGDTFTFYRGCAKTIAACEAYGNITHARLFPFLPVVSTLI